MHYYSTLAGSTIMLLTLPWLGSIILGRVDIIHRQGKDGVTKRFTIMSFFKQVYFYIFMTCTQTKKVAGLVQKPISPVCQVEMLRLAQRCFTLVHFTVE